MRPRESRPFLYSFFPFLLFLSCCNEYLLPSPSFLGYSVFIGY